MSFIRRFIPALVFLALSAVFAAFVGVVLFGNSVRDWSNEIRISILRVAGVGVFPIGVLVVALFLTLIFRREWLKKYNYWLSAALLVLAISGALSFFRPFDGWLAWFNLYGIFSLGGEIGDMVIGTPSFFGGVRLAIVVLAAVAVALPAWSKLVSAAIARGTVFLYVTLFMGVRSLLFRGDLPKVDSDEEQSPAAGLQRSDDLGIAGLADRDRFGAGGEDRGASAFGSSAAVISTPYAPGGVPAFVSPVDENGGYDPRPAVDPPTNGSSWEDEADDTDEPVPTPGPERILVTSGVAEDSQPKANRYWAGDGDDAQPASTLTQLRSQTRVLEPPMMANGSVVTWQMPSPDVFKNAPENPISQDELRDTAQAITNTLGEYGVEVEIGQVRPGPTVTMYGLVPGWVRRQKIHREVDKEGNPVRDESGRQITKRVEEKTRVKVDTILAREKDLALALKTPAIRIETPAMGRSLVGIEVPNPTASLVTLRSVMESHEYQKIRKSAHLPIALGRASGGDDVVFDLAKMPHLLVAGATGSGKSFCLNTIVSCLITEKSPSQLRLLLVDPKRVELTPYNGIPHLMAPVIVETDTVVGYLKGLIREMFDRYRRMEEVGVRNIEAYNKRMPDKMPFLCVVVDELADLMMTAAFDVEQSLCRLAQLGRATGIHLIIATQRPSVDVVTGLIKANFPSRISFSVTSQVDSRTILDTAGAEKLLGRGDMLYQPLDANKPARVQGVFLSDQEIEELINHWKSIPWARVEPIDLLGDNDMPDEAEAEIDEKPNRDNMMDKAMELALSHRKLSTSLLQRRLRIGYPRAARLMDQLEEEGVVGPSDGSKSRDVTINQS
jgi:energy-coupling factor transporter ATP-binding protein EcfA2